MRKSDHVDQNISAMVTTLMGSGFQLVNVSRIFVRRLRSTPTANNPRWIRIPDRNASQWIVSSPLLHSENATKVNQARGNRFKPLVKLLKYWNYNLPRTAQFRSFAIETIAVTLFEKITLPTLQDGLKFFFDFVVGAAGNRTEISWTSYYNISLGAYRSVVMDAAGTGSNVGAGVDEEKRNRFVEQAVRSRNK